MAEIINLRRARRAKARETAAATAAANRVLHGRTKAEKRIAEAEQARRKALLDGSMLDGSD